MLFLSKLHNNSILTGSVDSYCLVCDNYLRSEDEAFTHTEKPIHKKNMGAVTYLEKYKHDNIIKVKKRYYCSFCNILLSTAAKVGLHINESKHQENKGAQILRRFGDNIIAFNEVMISQQAWHGIVDNTCVVCNTEFDETDIHRSDNTHILNLIQSKCEFGDKYIYRKVDEDCFFCLTCSSVYAIEAKENHHEEVKHQSCYETGVDLKNKIPAKPKIAKVVVPSTKNDSSDTTNDSASEPVVASESIAIVEPNTQATKTTPDSKPETTDIEMTEAVDATTPKVLNDITTADKTAKTETAKTETAETETAKPETVEAEAAKTGTVYAAGAITSKVLDDKKPTGAIKKKRSKMNPAQPISKHDFIDTATKAIDAGLDPKLGENMSVNHFIVHEELHRKRCILCDISGIKEDEVNDHLYNDLHHQMMLKKYRNAVEKKANSAAAFKENILPSNVEGCGGKLYLKKSVPQEDIVKEEKIPSYKRVSLKLPTAMDIQTKIRRQNPVTDISSDDENEDRSKIIEMVDKLQNNNVTINFATDKAYCTRCNEDIHFNSAALEHHVIMHIHEEQALRNVIDPKAIIETFMRENFMETIENEARCKLCNVRVALDMHNLTLHVKSNDHVVNDFNMNGSGPGKLVKASEFMKMLLRVESNFSSDIVVNNAYVLRHLSFHCITQTDDKSNCVLCYVEFRKDNVDELMKHINSVEHKERMGLCKVATSIPEEFIREITPRVYHCGYCNKSFELWPTMRAHLISASHSMVRRQAMWNLERCHSIIRSSRPTQGEGGMESQVNRRGTEYNRSEAIYVPPQTAERGLPIRQYRAMSQEPRVGPRRN